MLKIHTNSDLPDLYLSALRGMPRRTLVADDGSRAGRRRGRVRLGGGSALLAMTLLTDGRYIYT
jgi:hypothetical protein